MGRHQMRLVMLNCCPKSGLPRCTSRPGFIPFTRLIIKAFITVRRGPLFSIPLPVRCRITAGFSLAGEIQRNCGATFSSQVGLRTLGICPERRTCSTSSCSRGRRTRHLKALRTNHAPSARFLLSRSPGMSKAPRLTEISQRRTIESLHRALDHTYRQLLQTAKTDWQHLFAGKDPSDACVSVHISKEELADELAGTKSAPAKAGE